MWIQIRTIDGKETRTVEDLSRLTKIESLRLKIQDIFNVSPQQQRLFYRGKQILRKSSVCHPMGKRGLIVGLGALHDCHTTVDMFVYIATTEKQKHGTLFPHVGSAGTLQTSTSVYQS
ncbi:hypothetical protein XENOCAPTIV_014877 [Xenoophorus captivus]|uniref:Ubiquitin-like domain-containing protein n=1 Tax=Xenoophorus captivus TaxID=1517983 RepID=A0ABV0R2F8_9TELE